MATLHRKCLALNQLLQIDTAAITASIHREVKDGRREQQQQHQSQHRALSHIRERIDDQDTRREQETILNWLAPVDYAAEHSQSLGLQLRARRCFVLAFLEPARRCLRLSSSTT